MILKFEENIKAYVPVLSFAPILRPSFKLTDGNLTALDDSLAAFYGEVPVTSPPPLLPLLFGENVKKGPFELTADFVITTEFSPSQGFKLQLFALRGCELKR